MQLMQAMRHLNTVYGLLSQDLLVIGYQYMYRNRRTLALVQRFYYGRALFVLRCQKCASKSFEQVPQNKFLKMALLEG